MALEMSGERAVDLKQLVAELPLAQVATLVNVWEYAVNGDMSVVEEFYMWLANRWLDVDPLERRDAAREGEGRYFSHEAFERYKLQDEEARRIGKEEGLNERAEDEKLM